MGMYDTILVRNGDAQEVFAQCLAIGSICNLRRPQHDPALPDIPPVKDMRLQTKSLGCDDDVYAIIDGQMWIIERDGEVIQPMRINPAPLHIVASYTLVFATERDRQLQTQIAVAWSRDQTNAERLKLMDVHQRTVPSWRAVVRPMVTH
jgi:hypothetical protein